MRQWLIDIRKEAAMTQAELAREVKISQPSYNAIESGKSNPKPETAKRIGKRLKFPWTRFYEEDENDEQVGAGG